MLGLVRTKASQAERPKITVKFQRVGMALPLYNAALSSRSAVPVRSSQVSVSEPSTPQHSHSFCLLATLSGVCLRCGIRTRLTLSALAAFAHLKPPPTNRAQSLIFSPAILLLAAVNRIYILHHSTRAAQR